MRDVSVISGVLAGCRRAALPFALVAVALLAPASAAQAQRLLTLVSGTAEAASVGDPGPSIGPVPTAVQVDLDLLRAAPARLEVPTPDGSVLSAEQSVFEDRGGGDLMWSGGQPGAGYDTVVLTLEGGRLVGRFGAAGGGAYQIHAERDGRGGMAPVVGPQPDSPVPFCGVEAGEEHLHDGVVHVAAGALPADPPERVSSPRSHDRLDILVAYTATAAENWADRGGALAAIRHAGDYLKMVFRNNDLPVEPHIVHIAQASAGLDRAGRDMPWHEQDALRTRYTHDSELRRLRHEHRADIRYVFLGERALLLGFCGRANQLSKNSTIQGHSQGAYAWSTNHPFHCPDYAVTFVHEIGHTLGADHDPRNAFRPERLFRPYAVGHANLDVMPSLGTAMSYPGQIEPFFSTPRIQPWGTVLGIADERDNERLLQETVHLGVQYSDYLRSLEGVPAPPGDLRAWFEGGAAHLAWRDNAPDADGYEVEYSPTSGPGATMRQKVKGRTGAILPLPDASSGKGYRFEVRATKGDERSLRSDIVVVVVPGEPIEAPSDVSATLSGIWGLDAVEVRWRDNSDNESWFDVQLLQDGDPILRERVAADSETFSFHSWWVVPQAGAEYGVRVFAFNASGYSESSEVATFRWQHPGAPGLVTGVSARATGPTTVRVSWTADPDVGEYVFSAALPGWDDGRNRPHNVAAGTAWTDFEGLARGGRYVFQVWRYAGVRSSVYLTLGERGAGPRAPSDVAWVLVGDRVRLSWKDNSSDELGFEVQYALVGSDGHLLVEDRGAPFWERLLTVPADTESATSSGDFVIDDRFRFRVFAYNDRGYSVGSPRVQERPLFKGLTATAGDTDAELRWDMWSAEAVTGMQARWKATADLPFDDAVDTWTDLPASARTYTVTGLRNGSEYTFAVRYVTALGPGRTVTTTATPRDPPPPRVPPKASFTVSADCSDDPCRVRTGEEISFTDTSTGDVTERHWSFGEGTTSDLKSPTHAWSTPGFHDVTLTVSDGSSSDSASRTVLVEAAVPAGSCRFDAETLCLHDSRFEVKANWWSAGGDSGPGKVVYAGTSDSGMFQFFDLQNWEILIKVLDGCGINGRTWVLGAATSDLGYRIVVTDTVTGESRSYENEPGQPAPAIVDTRAFSEPCGGGAGP